MVDAVCRDCDRDYFEFEQSLVTRFFLENMDVRHDKILDTLAGISTHTLFPAPAQNVCNTRGYEHGSWDTRGNAHAVY